MLDETAKAVSDMASRCKREGYKDTYIIANAALYLILAERDIAALKVDAFTHPNVWSRKLSVRVVILIVFEWNLSEVFDKRLYDAVDRLHGSTQDITELKSAARDFRRCQQVLQSKLKRHRNETIAHRDPDAIEVFKQIRGLREVEIMSEISAIYPHLKRIICVMVALIGTVGNVESLRKLKQTQASLL